MNDEHEKAANDAGKASEVALRHATSMNIQRLEFATELLNIFNRAILVHANRDHWIAEDWRAFNVAVSAIDSIGHRAVATAETARVSAQIEQQRSDLAQQQWEQEQKSREAIRQATDNARDDLERRGGQVEREVSRAALRAVDSDLIRHTPLPRVDM